MAIVKVSKPGKDVLSAKEDELLFTSDKRALFLVTILEEQVPEFSEKTVCFEWDNTSPPLIITYFHDGTNWNFTTFLYNPYAYTFPFGWTLTGNCVTYYNHDVVSGGTKTFRSYVFSTVARAGADTGSVVKGSVRISAVGHNVFNLATSKTVLASDYKALAHDINGEVPYPKIVLTEENPRVYAIILANTAPTVNKIETTTQ